MRLAGISLFGAHPRVPLQGFVLQIVPQVVQTVGYHIGGVPVVHQSLDVRLGCLHRGDMGLDEGNGAVEMPSLVLFGLVVLGFFLQFLDESVVFRLFLPVVKGKQSVQFGSRPVPVALTRLDGFALFDDARIDAV